MRVAASLAINGTGADPAIGTQRLRSRFVRLSDLENNANGLVMAVYPSDIASFELYTVDHPLSKDLPKDDAELQAVSVARIPALLADLVVGTTGQAELVSVLYAPGWYYCRQVSAGAAARRADLIPVAVNSRTL